MNRDLGFGAHQGGHLRRVLLRKALKSALKKSSWRVSCKGLLEGTGFLDAVLRKGH